MQKRDVVRVEELLRGRSGELAQTDGQHGRAQGVLQRLPGAEVGGERQGADHLGSTDRLLACRQYSCDRSGILRRHVDTLLPDVGRSAQADGAPAGVDVDPLRRGVRRQAGHRLHVAADARRSSRRRCRREARAPAA